MQNLLIGIALTAALVAVAGTPAQTHPGRLTAWSGAGGGDFPIRQGDTALRQLRSPGYSVTYRKLAGGHEVPPAISRAAVRRFLQR